MGHLPKRSQRLVELDMKIELPQVGESVTEGIITGDYDVLRGDEHRVFKQRRSVPEILEKHGMDPKEVASLIRGPDAGGSERNLLYWTEGSESFQSVDQTLAILCTGRWTATRWTT
mgnify:CR=1 FL=1